MDRFQAAKALVGRWRAALYDFEAGPARAVLEEIAGGALFRHCHPFGDLDAAGFWDAAIAPLWQAMPDAERRDWIDMAGEDADGALWVGCGGHYVGTFAGPFLGIPPTGHVAHFRFHEYYRVEDGRVVEFQAIWDLPELMMQAGIWPMGPSLGREMCIPGPATQDGLRVSGDGEAALKTVTDMLAHLSRHPSQGGPEVMEMERFWHPRMAWYGPAGIGTARGIAGFRNWHQIPFLGAMPDRGQYPDEVTHHFFAEGDYVAVTGWPDMMQTITGDGWLGIAPAGQRVSMRSLDFWRVEDGLIRENWVLVDLLHMWDQIGVDVLRRVSELAKARVPGRVPFPVGDP